MDEYINSHSELALKLMLNKCIAIVLQGPKVDIHKNTHFFSGAQFSLEDAY